MKHRRIQRHTTDVFRWMNFYHGPHTFRFVPSESRLTQSWHPFSFPWFDMITTHPTTNSNTTKADNTAVFSISEYNEHVLYKPRPYTWLKYFNGAFCSHCYKTSIWSPFNTMDWPYVLALTPRYKLHHWTYIIRNIIIGRCAWAHSIEVNLAGNRSIKYCDIITQICHAIDYYCAMHHLVPCFSSDTCGFCYKVYLLDNKIKHN